MSSILDAPVDPKKRKKMLSAKAANVFIALQLLFHFALLGNNLEQEGVGLLFFFYLLPLLFLYFLLPVFILFVLQLLLYAVQQAPFLEEGKGWALRLRNWQYRCTYVVVLIGFQLVITGFLTPMLPNIF